MSGKSTESRRGWSVSAGVFAGLASTVLALSACGSSGGTSASATGGGSGSGGSTDPVLTTSAAGQKVVDSITTSAAVRNLLPKDVVSKGSIEDFVNIPFEPMEMYKPGTNDAVGFDVDIAQAIGKVTGLKVNITEVQFPALLTSLTSGRADIVVSGTSDIPDRRKLYDFIDYFGTGDVLAIRKDDQAKYKVTDGLASMCGLTVVTGQGTSFPTDVSTVSKLYCTDKGKKAIGQIQAQSIAEAMVDVQTGRAQGFVDEGPEGLDWYVKTHPGTPWTSSGPVYFPNDYGVMMKKGNPLLPALTAAVKLLQKNGDYQKIGAAYGLQSGLLDTISVNSGPCECATDLLKK